MNGMFRRHGGQVTPTPARPPVDRLTHFASAFAVVVVFFIVAAWDDSLSSAMGAGTDLGAVLVGLVYTEQFLRDRDRRKELTPATASPPRAPLLGAE